VWCTGRSCAAVGTAQTSAAQLARSGMARRKASSVP
jgi:hypothetical protein